MPSPARLTVIGAAVRSAALLLSDRARAVRVVDRPAAAGLVTRVRDTVERRIRRVALTGTGRRHVALAAARRTRLLGEAIAKLAGRGPRPADGLPGAAQRLRGPPSAGVRRVRGVRCARGVRRSVTRGRGATGPASPPRVRRAVRGAVGYALDARKFRNSR